MITYSEMLDRSKLVKQIELSAQEYEEYYELIKSTVYSIGIEEIEDKRAAGYLPFGHMQVVIRNTDSQLLKDLIEMIMDGECLLVRNHKELLRITGEDIYDNELICTLDDDVVTPRKALEIAIKAWRKTNN